MNNAIFDNILETIGNTPLIKIKFIKNNWVLLLKMEKFNPGQSMKDRMALNMINKAEEKKLLKPGGVIIESSSGNTATGLAIVAAVKGYRFIAIVDHHASQNKIDIIQAYGGEIIKVGDDYAEDEVAVAERERIALQLSKKIKNSFFVNQADNFYNREAYIDTLAKELQDAVPNLNELFGAIGTGGSLCGTAIGLNKRLLNVNINAVEPIGSVIFGGNGGPYYQSGTGNPSNAPIPSIIDYSVINNHYYVSDIDAFNTCRYFAKHYGLLLGGSSGGVLYTAINELAKRKDSGVAVALMCDGGEKYIETIFNDAWMEKRNLLNYNIETQLKRSIL